MYHVGYSPRDGVPVRARTGLWHRRRVREQCARFVPVLIPISWFFNNLQSGNIDLMWAAIVGFVDVIVIMFAALWLVHRRAHRVISHVAITQPATPASRG